VLGGLMVEVGKRENKTGRLSAQRHGINQLVGVVSGVLGGKLARLPFEISSTLCAFLYVITVPLYWTRLKEPRSNQRNTEAFPELWRQCKVLAHSRILWSAAALVILVVAAPGFNTPLFYIQTNDLKFTKEFIGLLETIGAVCGISAAYLYTRFCRRFHLRKLLATSIIVHATLTLFYLLYKSPVSAMIITGIEQMTMVFALLPLYDLAARATPKGSEALGYSLMMSVWNFTTQLSNLAGSWLYTHWKLTFSHLVWVNSGTTILVLLAVPFLPSILVDRRDGDSEPVAT
jgi:predicted MFS family arabinose efflux permease